jgi:hypothetical protein
LAAEEEAAHHFAIAAPRPGGTADLFRTQAQHHAATAAQAGIGAFQRQHHAAHGDVGTVTCSAHHLPSRLALPTKVEMKRLAGCS